MGIKRWLLALLILVVVLGFVFFFFLQSGADEKIAEVVIPAVERKFDVSLTYDDVSVSLTSVLFKNVTLRPAHGDRNALPFAVIDRLGVRFRVGPLLVGDLDITGVRVDGLQIKVGERVKGASIAEWKSLFDAMKRERLDGSTRMNGAGALADGLTIPEIYIVSGDVSYDDTRFSGQLEELSGRITPGNKAVLQSQKWILQNEKDTSVAGDKLMLDYDFALNHLAVDLDSPAFTLPTVGSRLKALVSNAQSSLGELGLLDDPDNSPDATSDDPTENPAYLDVVVKIHSANGALTGKDARKLVDIRKVNVELVTSRKMLLAARASGGITGTDARWALQGKVPRSGGPSLILDVPELPLKQLGESIFDSAHVNWADATADGQLKLNFSEKGRNVQAEGQWSIAGLTISHERIAEAPLENLRAMLDYRVSFDLDRNMWHLERVQLSRDLARVTIRGDIQTDRLAFDLKINVPSTSCRQLMEAIPGPMKEKTEGVGLEGQLGMDMHFAFDVENLPGTVLDANLDNRCRINRYGSLLHPDDLRRPFAYMAYGDDGNRIRLTTGPGTNRWTPISQISPFLTAAVLTTEDGKFEHHRGLTLPEIRSAFLRNWQKDGLFHGGSTITMQLAKNLFLSRDRTVARKLQELFFVWYLESNFTKQEILELYFNVIEFGPSIYGIGEASMHYFGREPSELNLLESVFLVKLLPSPVSRHQVWEKSDVLGEKKTKSLHRVLETMRKRKRITEAEYNEALGQTISFYKEGMPLPEPRIPVQRHYSGGNKYYEEDVPVEEPPMDESMDENW
ncbi:MAG: transglycosylase domain-containing protein [Deltaproteobacteria bacterium]|nr:transglycosylase domain-containing protein [Deltaproteobacteria bacterium]